MAAEFVDAPVTVLIVDDQATFRAAARSVVASAAQFRVVAEAASGEAAIAAVADLRPDLVLMDINLPGVSGIEATRRLLAIAPASIVILLSTYTAADVPAEASVCGALAYVHKEDLRPGLLAELYAGRSTT